MEKPKIENEGKWASRLDAETSLAPMPPLGVVPIVCQLLLFYISCACRLIRCDLRGDARIRSIGVPDGVVCPQADPLGNGAVLLLSLCKLLLGAERLLGLWKMSENVESRSGHRGRAAAYRHRG